jgi:hypothetical protein
MGNKNKTKLINKRRGRVRGWTMEERRWLFECYEWSGGVNRGGYIEKVHNMYHCRECTPRSKPSLVAQLKLICNGGLTEMERSEIRHAVMNEKIEQFGWDSCYLEESFDETFEGFPAEGDEGDEMDGMQEMEEEMDGEEEVDMAV